MASRPNIVFLESNGADTSPGRVKEGAAGSTDLPSCSRNCNVKQWMQNTCAKSQLSLPFLKREA